MNDKFKKQFGKLIKKHRDNSGITQKELGEKIGMYHKSTICHYETGRDVPRAEVLVKICKELDISWQEVLNCV